ncbi:hypothetical protein [Thermophilibacter provencensis]|uniref:DUF5648 domain-containing protein n=1 Tax=Thermophilibacter provencensis TaxID=1852386 RepID=A0ABT7V429_9ACTN|nr:hypothetical protein [Thermophilibacter provencensis]MDM8271354.1 hypothetical protein [Thermophilibacter provencensis]
MRKADSGWMRRRAAVLLSAALVLAPFAATPAMAAEGGDVSNAGSTVEKSVDAEETSNDIEPRSGASVSMTQGDEQTVQYESLAAALADVEPYDYKTNKDTYTIALAQNVTEDVTIPEGVNVTIDLAGHTLTNAGDHTITNRSTRTVITDSVGGGVVDNVSHGRAAVYNNINASITLKGGTFSRSAETSRGANDAGGNSWYVLKNFGTMTISNGVTVKFSDKNLGYYSSLIGNGWQNSAAAEAGSSEPKPSMGNKKATLNINGGKFVGGKITVKNDDYGVLNVKGGSISQGTDSYYAIYNANKATISGGTISALSDAIGSEHYDGAANDGSLTVSGGTITSESGSAVALLGGAKGTIKGGTFQGGSGQYVIDVDESSSAAISAGTFVGSAADKVVNEDGSFVDRFGVVKDDEGNLVVAVTDALATVKALDGTVTNYESLSKALSNAPAGSTVTLQEDVSLTAKVATKNYGVTLDLNGHNVTSTVTSDAAIALSTNYGSKPVEGVGSTMRLINSVPDKGGEVRAAIPLGSKAGDSTKPLALEVGEGVTLVPTNPASDAVKLESSAYLRYSEQAVDYIKNGGFKVSAEDGDRIYGTYANAASASVDDTVTMLHDYAGTTKINSGYNEAVLDLGGHTYTYTGNESSNNSIAAVNYDGASLTIKNGTLKTTSDPADGILMINSDSSLVLEGVTVEVPHGSYGIVTNGQETNNTITLRNSELRVAEGAGIYFPSTGSVLIDNSVISAELTGVQICAGDLTVQGADTVISVTGQPVEKTEGDGVIADGAAISIIEREGYQDLGAVSITGGTFSSVDGVNAIKAYTYNNSDREEGEWATAGDVVTVSGGSFSTSVPADLCADGLKPVDGEDGSHTVGFAQDKLAAVYDAQGNVLSAHDSLSAAITAAGEGQTVTLLDDVTESVTIPADKNLTFDLAGYTLTGQSTAVAVTVENGAALAIKGGAVKSASGYAVVTMGSLETSDVTIGAPGGVQVGYQATPIAGSFTMGAGTKISATGAGSCGVLIFGDGTNTSSFVMNGGEIRVPMGFGISGNGSAGLGNTSIVINDGEVVSDNGPALYHPQSGELVLNGGSLTGCVGVQMCSGSLSVPEGSAVSVKSTGADDMADKGAGDGNIDDAAAISLIDRGYPGGAPKANIAGGSFTSEKGAAVRTYTWDNANGSSSDWAEAPENVRLSGGTYSNAPDEALIVPGSGLTSNDDGTFGIHKHVGVAVAAKDPTCTEAGNKAYWTCEKCDELFADKDMTRPTTLDDVTIAATDHQSVKHVPAKDATETEAGNHEYWYCADCDTYFSDKALTKETTLEELTIPAKPAPEPDPEPEPTPDPDPEPAVEMQVMYRLYNQWTREHLYTADESERDFLLSLGWSDEGEAWTAPAEGAPVYRLFNPYADDHHYTMSEGEVDALVALGWQAEGIAWRSAEKTDEGALPLYRLFNPYEKTATHHYTASVEERDALVKIGWQAEGIAWYGVSAAEK